MGVKSGVFRHQKMILTGFRQQTSIKKVCKLAALVLLDKSDDSQDKMEEILKQTAEKIESVVNSINVERKK